MQVINLFAGPGAGKSTTAYGLAHLFKIHAIEAELVVENAKNFTWEERKVTLACQPYVFGKQLRDLWRLKGKVDFAVTDSPILLSFFYADISTEVWPNSFYRYVVDQFNEFQNINFFIERDNDYSNVGRNQTFEEALEADIRIQRILQRLEIPYYKVKGDSRAAQKIMDHIEIRKAISEIQ
jgi:hypothetical protein